MADDTKIVLDYYYLSLYFDNNDNVYDYCSNQPEPKGVEQGWIKVVGFKTYIYNGEEWILCKYLVADMIRYLIICIENDERNQEEVITILNNIFNEISKCDSPIRMDYFHIPLLMTDANGLQLFTFIHDLVADVFPEIIFPKVKNIR